MRKNIIVEGLPGSGKSTLLNHLAEIRNLHPYREGDLSPIELAWCAYLTPPQWEDALHRWPRLEMQIREKTLEEDGHRILAYTQIPTEDKTFYREMERHEIYNGRVDFGSFRQIILGRYRRFAGEGNVFECSLLQNSIESMMLFYELTDNAILDFYRRAFSLLRERGFGVIYLDVPHVEENLLHIKAERSDENGSELWYPMMLDFLRESPYGKSHGYAGLADVVSHFERRRKLELRILREIVAQDGLILESKKYETEEIARWRGLK